MGATLVRNVSENDDWTITTDMRRAELYNYRCVLPTSMVPGRIQKDGNLPAIQMEAATQSAVIQSHPGRQA